jgi:hypothetical protein
LALASNRDPFSEDWGNNRRPITRRIVLSDSIDTRSVEIRTLNKLVETIQDVRTGLDPDVIARWYEILEAEAKSLCPSDELRQSIVVIQNPDLPMKFEFKSSKRAVPFVIEAIENNLNLMPFATRLYFQKFSEIMQSQVAKFRATGNPQVSGTAKSAGP